MCLNPVFIRKQWTYVPCGKCIECKINKSKEWAYRICFESKLYKDNCMITLTYNEANLPKGKTLVLKDFQNFIKRLRKKIAPVKVRYFGCGEYGDLKGRPHYHIILFGWKPADMTFFKVDKKGYKLYRSKTLESLWTFGFSSVGDVCYDSALYTAIYLQKTPTDGRKKPFVLMSKKPGIGFDAIDEQCLVTDKIYHNGKYIKTPRYWLKVLERDGVNIELLKEDRRKRFEPFNNEDALKLECASRKKRFEKALGDKLFEEENKIKRKKIKFLQNCLDRWREHGYN